MASKVTWKSVGPPKTYGNFWGLQKSPKKTIDIQRRLLLQNPPTPDVTKVWNLRVFAIRNGSSRCFPARDTALCFYWPWKLPFSSHQQCKICPGLVQAPFPLQLWRYNAQRIPIPFCVFPHLPQVRVVRFYQNVLPSPSPSPPLLPSSSSLPDITCQLVSAVRLAGLHLPHCWIASAVC